MADLIDREKLKTTIRNMVELPIEVRVRVLGAISRAKAVDAKPVVHGKWNPTGMHLLPYKCSLCGSLEEGRTKYCPSCGAKMDGGNDRGGAAI